MKKFLLLSAMSFMLVFNIEARANSLDDVISGQEQQATVEVMPSTEQTVTSSTDSNIPVGYDSDFVNGLRDANKNLAPSTQANKVNSALGKVASFLVQVLSYASITFLSVRVGLDLIYIALPFTRSILSNGHTGVASNPGVPGGGMTGGMAGGLGGGFGGGFGANRFGGGMSTMGAASQMQANQANMTANRIQLVSNEALNAVASSNSVGTDGSQRNVISIYFKSIVPILVGVPLILTLTLTGVLSDLGFLIGDALASFIASLGNMI